MELNAEMWKTLALLPIGLLMLLVCSVAGSLFDFYFLGEREKRIFPVVRLFMGYLLISTVFCILFFQGKTIFSVIGLVLFPLLIWNRGQIKIDFKFPAGWVQISAYCLLFGLRLASLVDFKSGSFGHFFKDDYFYTCNIASLFYSGQENVFYESLNQYFGFQSFYSIYHYFSFAGALFLKVFTGFNSYFLFHFFTVPFFQFFGLMGLFSMATFLGLNPWKAFILSMFVLSALRYNPFDDYLVEWINSPRLSRNLIFKNFFGIQFLNSGFGPKFSIALGLASLIYIYLDQKKTAVSALFFILINPLLIFLSGSVLVDILLFRRKNLLAFFGWSMLFLFLLVGFSMGMKTRPGLMHVDEVWANILRYLNLGPMHFIFFTIGEIMNQWYNLFLLPLILVLFKGKRPAERFFSALFVLYPIFNTYLVETLIYKGFIIALLGAFGYLFYSKRSNERLFYLVLIFGLAVFFSRFSLIFPELNQAFMFITFIFPLLLVVHLLSKISFGQLSWWVGFSALAVVNLGLNFKENRVRISFPSTEKGYFQKIQTWTKQIPNEGISPIGVFDSKMTFQFLNQFLTGEEIAQTNDRFLPTPISTPKLGKQNVENSKGIEALIPICNFVKQPLMADTTEAFLKTFSIKMVVVPDYDFQRFQPYCGLFQDSLTSDNGRYRIYFRR